MPEENYLNSQMQNKLSGNDEIKNLTKIFTLLLSHKYIFICSVVLTLVLAYLYNRFTIPVYKVSAAVMIEEDKKTSSIGNDQLLEGFGLMPGMKNFDNQVMVLSSRTLVNKTLDELALDMEYFYQGFLNKQSLYPNQPIDIITDAEARFPRDVVFAIQYIGNNVFNLKAEAKDSFKINKAFSFGETITLPGCSFRIEPKKPEMFKDKNSKKLYFTLHSRRKLVERYIKRLKIERASKLGSIVKISLEGTNKVEDLAFLSKLSEIFLNISLDRKNNEAVRTIQFIDDQLTGISDSLSITENKLQQFRSRNKVMNLSAQGQVIITQAMSLENEKARLGIEANYYAYLKGYLENDSAGEVPIAPATMGIADPGLTKLVADLAEQQGRLYSKSMGEKNPLQSQFSQKVAATKDALKETLKGLSSANSLALKETEEQISSINDKASALPKTERQLLGIERKYKLNDELYTFLLEKRAVAQMQKASNIPDNEMIDYADSETEPVKPNKLLSYLFALFAGVSFPLLWILSGEIFNKRLRDIAELSRITDIPIAGYIPKSAKKNYRMVIDEPDSIIAEAFRLLRFRLRFFTKEIKVPVILVTSCMAGEGKTFAAINIASAYGLLGKKAVLLGFDLRQPKIFSDFNLTNEKGISTWLIGSDGLEEIINKTDFENLDIITSGPVPPNPAELITLDKTKELFQILRKRYDCIIIDSSPVGLVSDTMHLTFLADTCILIVRQNFTDKEMLVNILQDFKISNIKISCLVVNDLVAGNRQYGYLGKYGKSSKTEPTKAVDKKRKNSGLFQKAHDRSYSFNNNFNRLRNKAKI